MATREAGDPAGYHAWLDHEPSDRVSLLLLALAPLLVVFTLAVYGHVLVAFVIYHVLVCLVVPAIDSLVFQDRSLSEHLLYTGLRPGRSGSLTAGAGMGLLLFAGVLAPFLVAGDTLLAQADLSSSLAAWGVPEDAKLWLFAYMLVFNSGAEELFWRGHMHQRLAGWQRRGLAIGLTTATFASYHVYTIYNLTGGWLVTGFLSMGVFFGGLVWAVLREHYGTAWPAILAHVGATAGYMTVYLLYV